jgi:hypothetical protein
VSSAALQLWQTVRAAALDEIEAAHRLVGGRGPGRRYATQQINHAYAVLLASQFQGFCRDLHTESASALTASVLPARLRQYLREEFAFGRRLDRGNPNPANIGADFGRLGVESWTAVEAADARTGQRRQQLALLNEWRNAIAHQDFNPARLGGLTALALRHVRAWRGACSGLAVSFDTVMRAFLAATTGVEPW